MPIKCKFDPVQFLLICTANGELTFDQVIDIQEVYFEKYRPRNMIVDLSLASVKKLETRDVESIADVSDRKRGLRPANSKTAIVATSPLVHGLSRMYAIFSEFRELPWELGVFHSLDEALDWIGPGSRSCGSHLEM